MKRIWILFLAFVLAACSGHTLTTLRVRLDTYLPNRSGQLSLLPNPSGQLSLLPNPSGQLSLPTSFTVTLFLLDDDGDSIYGNDPDGLALELPRLDILERARLRVRLSLKNTTGAAGRVGLRVRVAPRDDRNIYDDSGGYTLLAGSVNLESGKEKPLDLEATLGGADPAFGLLKGGNFRVGLELSLTGTGTTVNYTLEEADVSLSGRLFGAIPD